jgi:CBS domain-containing protein
VSSLHGIQLVPASVPADALFEDAAAALAASRLSAIAVLENERVVGLFTEEDLLLGLSPGYVDELQHTAFLEAELPSLQERATAVRREPVRRHMRKPVTIERDTSRLHAVERFVHGDEGAIAVVDEGRFAGMLSRAEFAYAMLQHLSET